MIHSQYEIRVFFYIVWRLLVYLNVTTAHRSHFGWKIFDTSHHDQAPQLPR